MILTSSPPEGHSTGVGAIDVGCDVAVGDDAADANDVGVQVGTGAVAVYGVCFLLLLCWSGVLSFLFFPGAWFFNTYGLCFSSAKILLRARCPRAGSTISRGG